MEVWNAILKELHTIAFIILFIIFIAAPLADYFKVGFDDSDSDTLKERSGLVIYTDYKTGLQYIQAKGSDIHPRLDINGNQMKHKGN